MKKAVFLVLALILSISVPGQQSVDIILKARSLKEAGKPDLAIKILETAIGKVKDSRLYTERAEANIMKGNYSDAISDYNEANKLTPNSGEYGLSRIYALKGDAATALYHLETNLNSTLHKSEKEILLDPCFELIENRPEWRQFWKKEWFSDEERTISEIEYYVSKGKIDESKDLLSELKKDYKSDDDVSYAEALISFSSGKYSEANNILNGLIELHPENEKYLRILAKTQSASSNPAGASVTYTKLMDEGVADAELLLLRAECFRKTGETDKALIDTKKYLDLYPENKNAISLAGKLEAVSGDNLKAIEYFSANLKLNPNDAECYIDRANSYFVSTSWDLAIKDYSMSLDLKPGNPDVWLNMGISLLKTGKKEDACHYFNKSLSLGNRRASPYVSSNCIK
jgi:tetratricopeptide (TPR) repeat protein